MIVLEAEREPVADRVPDRVGVAGPDAVTVIAAVPVPETELDPDPVPDWVSEGVPEIVCVGDLLGVGKEEPERVAVMDFVDDHDGVIEGVTVGDAVEEAVSVRVVEPVIEPVPGADTVVDGVPVAVTAAVGEPVSDRVVVADIEAVLLCDPV